MVMEEEGRIVTVETKRVNGVKMYSGELIPLHNFHPMMTYSLTAYAVKSIGMTPKERRLVKYKKVSNKKAQVIDILK
jgi:hypothetical protein